jgi:GH43 family beta-xylosidase
MTPEQFIFWLNGYLEIENPKEINEKQVQIIKDHIALVLKKETPNRHQIIIKEDPKIFQTLPAIPTPQCRADGSLFQNCGNPLCPKCSTRLVATC